MKAQWTFAKQTDFRTLWKRSRPGLQDMPVFFGCCATKKTRVFLRLAQFLREREKTRFLCLPHKKSRFFDHRRLKSSFTSLRAFECVGKSPSSFLRAHLGSNSSLVALTKGDVWTIETGIIHYVHALGLKGERIDSASTLPHTCLLIDYSLHKDAWKLILS